MHTDTEDKIDEAGRPVPGPFYTLFIDGTEYRVSEPFLTGREIMELGEIALEVGLILLLDDNTQRQILPDETIELKPGRRFKKAPRFKRG